MVDFHDAPVKMEPLLIDGSRPAYGALIGRSESASTFMRLDHCYRTSTRRETLDVAPAQLARLKATASGNELAGRQSEAWYQLEGQTTPSALTPRAAEEHKGPFTSQ